MKRFLDLHGPSWDAVMDLTALAEEKARWGEDNASAQHIP